MNTGVISVRYARALLKCGVDANLDERVYEDMTALASAYINVPALRETIDNPMISKETKEGLLVAAVGGKPSELTLKFFALVLKEGREDMMQFMANSYVTLYRKKKNIIRGKLTTAVAVSADTEQKMRRLVESNTNGTVDFETEIDPEIIGGFVLEYDTYRMDASVKSNIQNILTQLKK